MPSLIGNKPNQVPTNGDLGTMAFREQTQFYDKAQVDALIPTIASTAEAQAGTNNTNFITPLRMREGFNASGSAPVYACRAWVNFDGTTATPSTIRGSGNVSSVTKVGTGIYVVNITNAMPDANYVVVDGGSNTNTDASTLNGRVRSHTYATTSFRVNTISNSSAYFDHAIVCLSVFR